jgi:cellulase/cellobiase CelA1
MCSGGICVQPPPLPTATFESISNWNAGYCVNLRVTNNAALPTSSWNVVFDTNQSTIYTSWNATFSGNSGAVTVSPLGWNSAIAPGATNSTVGFCAHRATVGSGVMPSIVSTSATF